MGNVSFLQRTDTLFPERYTGAQPRANTYTAGNMDRQTRFQLRSRRRWGDWGVLEFPSALLWFDDECVLDYGEPFCIAPAPIFLWPE
jgi:hypothetical protein